MTDKQLKRLKDKGFTVDAYAHKVSKMYLLTCLLQDAYLNYCDYSKKFGIGNEFRNDIATLERNTRTFLDKVKVYISDDAKVRLMEDFEHLDASLEDILNQLEKNFYKSEKYEHPPEGKSLE